MEFNNNGPRLLYPRDLIMFALPGGKAHVSFR